MKFPTGREFETRVECALETYFVAGRFATVWALRLRVPDEFIAGGLHKEQSTCLGTVSQAIARWQRGSSAGSVINWIFYCSIDCSLARSCCLMGIELSSDIFSRSLTMIRKVSPRRVISQGARTRLNVYSAASRQQPASEHFTLLGFRVGVTIVMALVDLHLREIMDLVGWKKKRRSLALLLVVLMSLLNLSKSFSFLI